MKPIDIGDVQLVAKADGRITLTIDPWYHVTATWTLAGAQEGLAWLQAWIHEQDPHKGARAGRDEAAMSTRVLVTYTIDCDTTDEEHALASVVPFLPSDMILGMPQIVLTQVPPEEEVQ
jgi:hypothetical protein